jgi:phage terminase small subunit
MAIRKDENGLTPKRIEFCRAYLELSNASEAYRRAYDCKAMKAETIRRRAYDLMQDGHVKAHIASLKAEHDGIASKSLGLSREWIIERLMRNAELGFKEGGKPEGAVSNKALELLGKVDNIGLFEERINQTGEIFVIAAPEIDEEQDVEGWAQGHGSVAP